MPVIAGVDSSTQSTTVALYDSDDGRPLATASAPHPPTTPPVSEQNPHDWWRALGIALDAAKTKARVASADITGISVAAQCHGLIVLDSRGAVIRPAKLWNDTTAEAQTDRLRTRFNTEEWVRRVGSLPSPAFTIAKLAWLAENEPDNFRSTRRIALPHDWLTLQLTGEFVSDRSDASGTGYYSASRGAYDEEILAFIDPNRDWIPMLPAVHDPDRPAGRVLPGVADELGISPVATVGPGSGDQHSSAVGLGVEPSDVVFVFGTSGVVYALSPSEVLDPRGDVNCVASATGGYQPLVCTLNATKVTDAFARLLAVDYDELGRLALAAPSTSDRPVLAAYLDGERSPDRPRSRGLLGGFSSAISREELALASFEGVVLGLAEGYDSLERIGSPLGGRVIASGGGAASPAYLQVLADTIGTDVLTVATPEPVARGAAIQVAAILSETPLAEVQAEWKPTATVAATPRHEPDPMVRDRYHTAAAWTGLDL
jgi:xylulokinase